MTLEPIPSPLPGSSPSPFPASPLPEGGIDLREMGGVLLKRAWLIVLLAMVGGFGSLYYLKSRPHIYYAQAVLEVDPGEQKIVNFQGQEAQENLGMQDMLDSYVAILKSRPFLSEVVRAYDLNDNADFLGFPLNSKIPEDVAINILMGCEDILIRPNTRFIELGIRHKKPDIAQFLANALGTELIKQGMQESAANSQMAVDILLERAKTLKKNLTDSETEQEDFLETHGALSLNANEDTAVADMKNQSANLNNARGATTRLQADDEAAIRLAGQPDQLLNVPTVADDPTIVACKQRIADMEAKIVTLNLRYTDLHPKMIEAKAELDDAKAALAANLQRMPTLIHAQYVSALAKQQKFEEEEQTHEKQIMVLNKQSIAYNILHGTVEMNQALYESVLRQLGQTQVAEGIDTPPVKIFESALLPGAPLAPSKVKVLAIGIASGVAVALAIALGLNAMDTSFRSVDQAERTTGLPVAGAIPVASRGQARSGWILQRDPGSSVAEAFRSLRAFLFFKGKQKRPKTVIFTSSIPGEGKTFCSINCAVSLAQQGLRTVLIDADLRAPAVARVLRPEETTEGLTGILEGRVEIREAIQPLEIDCLYLISGGQMATNPAELLARPEFGILIAELEEQFDCIIIDSAPILPVCDTLLLVPHAESVCIVVQANKTPRKAILRTKKLLFEAGASIGGLLMNMLSPKSDPDHYVYRQKYGAPENYGGPVYSARLQLAAPGAETAAKTGNGTNGQNGGHG